MKKRYQLKRGRRAACEYDVLIYRDDNSRQTVSAIKSGRTWTHV